jgi:hypothetical protein
MKETIKTNWIYKLFKWFSKDKAKDLCSRCKKNKAEAVIKGNQLCLECISNYNQEKKVFPLQSSPDKKETIITRGEIK